MRLLAVVLLPLASSQAPAPLPAQLAAQPAARIDASVTRGIAPLSVFFDALGTPGVDPHAAEYRWDFADPGSSHPDARGFCAAHVFERPGRYDVTLRLSHAGAAASASVTVEVAPFAGTTVYASSTSGHDTSDGLAPERAVATWAQALQLGLQRLRVGVPVPVRVLLRRGEVFPTSQPAQVPALRVGGPFLVSAWGEGPAPIVQAESGAALLVATRASGIRLVDLELRGSFRFAERQGGKDQQLLAFAGGRDHLLLRCTLRGAAYGVAEAGDGKLERSDITLCDCVIEDCRDYCAYLGGERLALLGNRFARVSEMHVCRIWYARKAVLSGNELLDPSVHTGLGRHALKLHAWAGNGPSDPPLATEWVWISENRFRGAAWPVAIAPQNRERIERIANVVVERNRFLADVASSTPTDQMLTLCATDVTVRDNVLLGSARGPELLGIALERYPLLPPCARIRICGNTLHWPRSGKDAELVLVAVRGADARDVVVERNVVSAPGALGGRTALIALERGAPLAAVRERRDVLHAPPGAAWATRDGEPVGATEWNAAGSGEGSLRADPGLADPGAGDVRRRPGSPADAAGAPPDVAAPPAR